MSRESKVGTLNDLLKIRLDPVTGRLIANWDELPSGEWTKDINWIDNPADQELAVLAVISWRNLQERIVGDTDAFVKIPGIADGMATSMWYADEPTKRKVFDIASLAILVAIQPIPRGSRS